MDLSVLSQILPMAGAGASGFMQGNQQGMEMKQLKQIMAMREANEMRATLRHPEEMRSMKGINAARELDTEQSRAAFPVMQRGRELAVKNTEHMYGPSDPGLNAMIKDQYGYNVPPEAMHSDVMAMIPGMNSQRSQAAMTYRAGMPKAGSDPHKRFDRLMAMRKSIRDNPSDMATILQSADPEIKAAFVAAGRDRIQLQKWIEDQMDKEQPGWRVKASREDEAAAAFADAFVEDDSSDGNFFMNFFGLGK